MDFTKFAELALRGYFGKGGGAILAKVEKVHIFLGTCRIILSSSMYVYSQELLRVLAPSFENNGQVDNEVWKSAEQPKGGRARRRRRRARLG